MSATDDSEPSRPSRDPERPVHSELIRCADSDVLVLFQASLEEGPGSEKCYAVHTCAFQFLYN
jgi:hypothetical protein